MAGTVKDAVPLHYGRRQRQQVPPKFGVAGYKTTVSNTRRP
jgi:hypothetical protein